jgi:hypothetical protein
VNFLGMASPFESSANVPATFRTPPALGLEGRV